MPVPDGPRTDPASALAGRWAWVHKLVMRGPWTKSAAWTRSAARTKSAALAVAVILPGLLAACAAPEPRPAFVAYGDSGNFGYSETRLAEDSYQVTYVTPYVQASADPQARDAELADQKNKAYELALWRAAQLAEKAGYPAFAIENESRDADVTVRTQPTFSQPYDPLWNYYDNGPPYQQSPFYGSYPSQSGTGYYHQGTNSYNAYAASAVATITAQLRVHLLKEAATGSLDSKATATQLAARYGSATYPASSYPRPTDPAY